MSAAAGADLFALLGGSSVKLFACAAVSLLALAGGGAYLLVGRRQASREAATQLAERAALVGQLAAQLGERPWTGELVRANLCSMAPDVFRLGTDGVSFLPVTADSARERGRAILTAADADGNTALLQACVRGHVDAMDVLEAAAAAVERVDVAVLSPLLCARNAYSCTALHLAAMHNHPAVIGRLLDIRRYPNTVRLAAYAARRTTESGWTALHLAAAKGSADAALALLRATAALGPTALALDAQDRAGSHTALLMAAHNGFTALASALLAHGADAHLPGTKRLITPLLAAALVGDDEMVDRLLLYGAARGDAKRMLAAKSSAGATALHLAAEGGHVRIIARLVDEGLDPSSEAGGSTPLMAALMAGKLDAANALLALPTCALRGAGEFGLTALHLAAAHSQLALARRLLEVAASRGELAETLLERDYDGLTPLHAACRARGARRRDASAPAPTAADALAVVQALVAAAGDLAAGGSPRLVDDVVNARDYGESTPLIVLAWNLRTGLELELASELVRAGADPALESEQGWTALHVLANLPPPDDGDAAAANLGALREQMATLLRNAMSADALARFDPNKPRDLCAPGYQLRRGPQNRIPLADRSAVLQGDFSLRGAAAALARVQGRPFRVMVMAGAGMSVASGIPDYRSKGTGMYAREETRSAFSLAHLVEQPDQFLTMVRGTFAGVLTGAVAPTLTHHLLALLAERGHLVRVYTQNIDMLELAAGVPDDLVVQSHGTLARWRCLHPACAQPADTDFVWRQICGGVNPTCETCKAPLRPDVVFFGEPLPARYHECRNADTDVPIDLLLVIGTSLVVYPFASLCNEVPLLTPRLLLNREPVGPFKRLADGPVQLAASLNYRDVMQLGDCDSGAEELANALGLGDALRARMARGPVRLPPWAPVASVVRE